MKKNFIAVAAAVVLCVTRFTAPLYAYLLVIADTVRPEPALL